MLHRKKIDGTKLLHHPVDRHIAYVNESVNGFLKKRGMKCRAMTLPLFAVRRSTILKA